MLNMKNKAIAAAIFLTFNACALERSAGVGAGVEDVDQLNVRIAGYDPVVRVMQYNVNNAVVAEKVEETKWANRYPRVIKLVNEAGPDIVSINELRELSGTIPVKQFLALFGNHESVSWRRNASKLAFAQAILYKPENLFPLASFPRWLSATPDQVSDTWTKDPKAAFGSMVLCAKFAPVYNGKMVKNAKPFWIFNVHFGLEEDLKTKSCSQLLNITHEVAGDDPFLICGDFNTFFDRDGARQVATLASKLEDLSKELVTLKGLNVKGTFIGDESDPFKAPFPLKENMRKLDYIWASPGVTKVGDTVVYAKTMLDPEPEELTTRKHPSDHLPVLVNVKIFSAVKKLLEKRGDEAATGGLAGASRA